MPGAHQKKSREQRLASRSGLGFSSRGTASIPPAALCRPAPLQPAGGSTRLQATSHRGSRRRCAAGRCCFRDSRHSRPGPPPARPAGRLLSARLPARRPRPAVTGSNEGKERTERDRRALPGGSWSRSVGPAPLPSARGGRPLYDPQGSKKGSKPAVVCTVFPRSPRLPGCSGEILPCLRLVLPALVRVC